MLARNARTGHRASGHDRSHQRNLRNLRSSFSPRPRKLRRGQPELLPDVPPNIEAPAFHRRVVPGLEDARGHPPLHRFADGPVLPVYQVPELDGVGRVERQLGHLGGMEEELADEARATGPVRPKIECRHVLGREAEQQVGVDQLPLVADPLVLVQSLERLAVGRSARGEGPRALTVRDPPLPVEIGTRPAA